MFRLLETLLFGPRPVPGGEVLTISPIQLSRWLDELWKAGASIPAIPGAIPGASPLGDSAIIDTLDLPDPATALVPPLRLKPSGISAAELDRWTGQPGPGSAPVPIAGPSSPQTSVGLFWHHLFTPYCLESTGMYEVFAEVARLIVVGESLGTLSQASMAWVRTTEELIFRDPPLFRIHGITSELRPSSRVSRRIDYMTMFGLQLPHAIPPRWGPSDESQWTTELGNGVNRDFRAKWAELLRQVWLGIENRNNSAGSNPADDGYILLLTQALRDMLGNRRRNGRLAREEFAHNVPLSWFHYTLLVNNAPIVVDLKAEGSSPEQRLSRIAERVGMTPAARSRELFLLAEPASALLRAIEVGLFDTIGAVRTLYDGSNPTLAQDMNEIIDLWQSATGERVKDRPIGNVKVSSPQPLRIPSANGSSAPALATVNGAG